MKVSKYLEIFRALSYPELFSGECLDAMKNIQQSEYGKMEAAQAIYEIRLNTPDPAVDVTFKVYDAFLKNHWLEFDFKNYSSRDKLQPCVVLEPEVFDNQEVMQKVFGYEKWENLKKSVDNLEFFLRSKNMRIQYLTAMDSRGGEFSESVHVEIVLRTYQRVMEIFEELPYSGDKALFENTVSELDTYARGKIFGFSFELFPYGRISDRIGAAFFAKTSLKDAKDLMNLLVRNDFCIPEKSEQIIKWRRDKLPEDICNQEICHIKFCFEKEKITSVKAYLRHSADILFIRSSGIGYDNVMETGIGVARELGCEVSEDEAKSFVAGGSGI